MHGWLTLVPACLVISGCTAIRTVQPAELNPPHTPARIWVRQTDGTSLVIDSPTLSSDTLSGMVNGRFQYVPLANVAILRAREPAPGRTAELLLVTGGAVTALYAYLAAKTGRFCGGACPVSVSMEKALIATCACC